MTITSTTALSATETSPNGQGKGSLRIVPPASQPQNPVNPRFTSDAVSSYQDTKVPCSTGCGRLRAPGTVTGMCRHCWLSSRPRDERKRDPERMASIIGSLLNSYARQAAAEDPGLGLAGLLRVQRQAHELANEVGRALVAKYGAAVVGAELGMTTQAAFKRWGGDHA